MKHCATMGIAAVIAAITSVTCTSIVMAQTYPTRAIRMIVTLAAGGPVDTVARIVAARLGEQLGQQVVVDNRPGAGGSVGGEAVARAPADGYTLLMAANGTIAIAPHLISNLPYDAQRDFAPVSLVGTSPQVLLVHPSLPVRTVKEFITLAQTRPGEINFGSAGNGATGHLASELLRVSAKIDIVHVPYRGAGPAMADLVAGQTQMLITGVSSALPFINSGRLRALGVTSPKRISVLPTIQAIAETLPGYEVISWYGIYTTAGTPAAVIGKLHQETVKTMANPETRNRLIAAGVNPETNTPDEFAAMVRTETAKWGKLIKSLNIRL